MHLTRNEAYLGHMVQFKTGSISFKNHKLVDKPEEEWIRVENTHEPIIGKEQWDMAQQIAASKRKPRKMSDGGTNMYVGILRCADCGTNMRTQLRRYKHKDGSEAVAYQFLCGNYERSGKSACTVHAIAEKALTEMLLEGIRADAVFSNMLNKYEKERLDKSEKAEILRGKITADEQTQSDASAWIKLMKKYANVDTLSAAVLLDLIEHIEIGEAVSEGGEKIREVKIFYRFAGNVNLAALTLGETEARYGQAV